MAKVSRSYLNRYNNTIIALAERASTPIVNAIKQFVDANLNYLDNLGGLVDTAKQASKVALRRSEIASQELSRKMLNSVLAKEGIEIEEFQRYGLDYEAFDRTIDYQVSRLARGEIDLSTLYERIVEACEYHLGIVANYTTIENVDYANTNGFRDKKVNIAQENIQNFYKYISQRKGARRIGWARVPTSAIPCDWCTMLASRGFVYHTEETAEAATSKHRRCYCIFVPGVMDETEVAGYDPDYYYQEYVKNDVKKHFKGLKELSSEEQKLAYLEWENNNSLDIPNPLA